ncbi:RHS repeat-associated core domain-containing protein [Danxiaibacter flavus]|uniref:RHS repeat-associated core domain-containing protein n=1 Tax=Danxiaibacter flavus TaxID=3049108 RepID=A0ABV3ZNU5_9BACT|nr:RHS repeat-associated core domain-containing protein [Chitinophagaceae bacterium DXS]
MPASGYAFVYVSNTSSTNVYFDNLKIIHERGRILQEHHYYPYGLEIANISSRAYGKLDNGWRYQGTFSEFEEETGWTNFDLRSYDAQLGRWISVDPYDQYASGYVGMESPVNGVDEDGGLSLNFGELGGVTGSVLVDRLLVTAGGAALGYGIDKLTGGKDMWALQLVPLLVLVRRLYLRWILKKLFLNCITNTAHLMYAIWLTITQIF